MVAILHLETKVSDRVTRTKKYILRPAHIATTGVKQYIIIESE